MQLVKKAITKFNNSNMLKNVTKISSGTILGQLISLVTLPIFTRLYGATVIGYWALFTSVATIVNSFSDLGMSNAIMIEEDENQRKRLFSVITTLGIVFSVVVSAGYFVYYTLCPNDTGIHPLFYAVVLAVLIFTQQQIQLSYSWLNKKKQYNILMKNPVVNQLTIAIIAIPLGLMGKYLNIGIFITYGYYIGLILGQFLTLVHMRRFIPAILPDFNVKHHIANIKKYREFVQYQTPTNFLAQLKTQTPVLLIKMFFGPTILGYYSVTQRILGIPINLLANAIGKVYYQSVVEVSNRGESVGQFTFKNMERAMKIALVPMVLIMGFGDIASVFFLGADYSVAGNLIRIISLMTFFTFLMIATQGIAIVIHKQKYMLISAVVQIIGYVAGLSIGKYVFDNIYIACFLMVLTFCIAQIVYFCAIFKVTGISPWRYLKGVLLSLGVMALGTAVIRILLLLIFNVPII